MKNHATGEIVFTPQQNADDVASLMTNPVAYINDAELLFSLLDMHDSKGERRKIPASKDFPPHEQDFPFSHFSNLAADEMMELVREYFDAEKC